MNLSSTALPRVLAIVVFAPLLLMAAPKPPAYLAKFFRPGQSVLGEVGLVTPPEEIQKYVNKVTAAAKNDPEWFKEYSTKTKPGVPLPFDEKLGLTQQEYQKYRELWDSREFKPYQKVNLRLEYDGTHWKIKGTGKASRLSLIKYDTKTDAFISRNGPLTRIEDIDADPDSFLGKWTGQEWKFEEKSSLGATKENFAIGTIEKTKKGILVYRLQDISSTGRLLFDESMLIQFDLPKK